MARKKAINKINKDFEDFEICSPMAANSLLASGSRVAAKGGEEDLSFRDSAPVFSSGRGKGIKFTAPGVKFVLQDQPDSVLL